MGVRKTSMQYIRLCFAFFLEFKYNKDYHFHQLPISPICFVNEWKTQRGTVLSVTMVPAYSLICQYRRNDFAVHHNFKPL